MLRQYYFQTAVAPAEGQLRTGFRHYARSSNFQDQSIFSYAHPGKGWWGYA